MTVAWRRSKLARKEPARVLRGESTWTATPLAVLPTYPRAVRDALAVLAESNPTPEAYEAEKARILASSTR